MMNNKKNPQGIQSIVVYRNFHGVYSNKLNKFKSFTNTLPISFVLLPAHLYWSFWRIHWLFNINPSTRWLKGLEQEGFLSKSSLINLSGAQSSLWHRLGIKSMKIQTLIKVADVKEGGTSESGPRRWSEGEIIRHPWTNSENLTKFRSNFEGGFSQWSIGNEYLF